MWQATPKSINRSFFQEGSEELNKSQITQILQCATTY